MWRDLHTLSEARADHTVLHLVVAAECMTGLKCKLDDSHIHVDIMHVT